MNTTTGADLYRAAKTEPDLVFANRLRFEALTGTEAAAAREVAYLLATLPLRADVPHGTAALHERTRRAMSYDVVRSFHRALPAATNTFAAMVKGTPSPVHGAERAGLAAALHTVLSGAGFDLDETAMRQVTYRVADIVAAALHTPAVRTRRYPVAPTDLGIVDTDDDLDDTEDPSANAA